MGSIAGLHFGIAAIAGERHELGLAAVMYLHPVPGTPPDLECGCYHGIGYNGITGGSATYAYLLYPGKFPHIWRIALRGGIIAGGKRSIHDFRRIPARGPYDANYAWTDEWSFGYGIVLRPTVDIALSRYFGLSAGPYAVLSNSFNGGGVTFGVMIGRVNRSGLLRHLDAWKRRVRPSPGQW